MYKNGTRFSVRWSGPKIGIVARGSSTFSNDENRSFDLKMLVVQLPKNVSYVVLQNELSDDERAFIDGCDNLIAPGEALKTFLTRPRFAQFLTG